MPEGPELSDAVRRIADANLRYYQGLGRLTVDYVRALAGLFGDLRASAATAFAPAAPAPARAPSTPPPAPAPAAPRPVLVLEGVAGADASAVFRVSNDLRRAVSAPVVVSPFHDEAGREHRLALRVDPAVVELEAGAQTLVEVHATIPLEAEAGVAYLAEVTVPGLAAGGVPLVLRRLPDPPPAEAPAASTATTSKSRKAPKSSQLKVTEPSAAPPAPRRARRRTPAA